MWGKSPVFHIKNWKTKEGQSGCVTEKETCILES